MSPRVEDFLIEEALLTRERLKNIKYRDLVLLRSVKEIKRASAKLNLPSEVVEEAVNCLIKALGMGMGRDVGYACLEASCLYLAVRSFNLPLSLRHLLASVRCCCKRPYRAIFKVVRELKFKLNPLNPEALLPYILRELALPQEVEARAFELLEPLKVKLRGRSPKTVAAAAVLQAAGELGLKLHESEVAKVIDVTPTTLRKAKRALSLGGEAFEASRHESLY
ncbi:MAG: hypothetical protein DRJ69_02520 [Thermoprotei archaeon]|nr:MAG: hypothetical protein DRJ69_02520 [Thermoprotei archaeon]